jgi:hypothetical protein
MASQPGGLSYAQINGTILAILTAALLGYLLVMIDAKDRLITELVESANRINDPVNAWNGVIVAGPEAYSPVDMSQTHLIDVLKHLALGLPHNDLPTPSEKDSRGKVLTNLFRSIGGQVPFTPPYGEQSVVTRDDATRWASEVRLHAGNAWTIMNFGKATLGDIARAADGESRRSMSEAGVPTTRIEEVMDAIGVQKSLAAFGRFIENTLRIASEVEILEGKIKRYETRQPSKRLQLIAFAISAAAFICGVIVPMLDPSTPHLFSVYLPVGAYLVALAAAALLLIRRAA